jgi:TPR repeat protein
MNYRTLSLQCAVLLGFASIGLASAAPTMCSILAAAENYKMAYKVCVKESKEQNSAQSQSWLGYMYENGLGTKQNFVLGRSWYLKSAHQGYAISQSWMGYINLVGQGVKVDYGKASRWFKKAADQNYPPAQSSLANMYELGQGVPKDLRRAIALYQKAAAQNDQYAISSLERLKIRIKP